MVSEIGSMLSNAVSDVASWIYGIFEATDAVGVYLGCLIAFLCVRFFISNVMKTRVSGGFWGQSDLAGSNVSKSSDSDRLIDYLKW